MTLQVDYIPDDPAFFHLLHYIAPFLRVFTLHSSRSPGHPMFPTIPNSAPASFIASSKSFNLSHLRFRNHTLNPQQLELFSSTSSLHHLTMKFDLTWLNWQSSLLHLDVLAGYSTMQTLELVDSAAFGSPASDDRCEPIQAAFIGFLERTPSIKSFDVPGCPALSIDPFIPLLQQHPNIENLGLCLSFTESHADAILDLFAVRPRLKVMTLRFEGDSVALQQHARWTNESGFIFSRSSIQLAQRTLQF